MSAKDWHPIIFGECPAKNGVRIELRHANGTVVATEHPEFHSFHALPFGSGYTHWRKAS